MAKYGKPIQVGPSALPPAGHVRRETLKRRADNLAQVAEEGLNNTETAVYSIDPAKLKEEPEILRHYDVSLHMFKVSHPVAGRVYFWERNAQDAIARKRTEARMWLGDRDNPRGWTVVQGKTNADGTEYPEAPELMQADGTRTIGDTLLMWIPLHEYEKIQKRIMLATRYKESNITSKMSDFVRANEGLVKVVSGNADPQELYRRAHPAGGPLQHTDRLAATE